MIPTERKKILEFLAEKLGRAWLDCVMIETPEASVLPTDREEAYFVQDQMAQVIGESLSGWKVGATSAKMRELDGHDDVIPGRIFESVTSVGAKQSLPFSRFADARVEPEFAFRLTESCPLRANPWTAAELADKVVLHPAVEIIGNRHQIEDISKSQNSLMGIADNGGGIGFVFGEAYADWNEIDFKNQFIRFQVDDNEPAENFFADMRCEPLEALADLINHLAARGFSLKKGDFASTGAAAVPQVFGARSHVTADFGAIGSVVSTFT